MEIIGDREDFWEKNSKKKDPEPKYVCVYVSKYISEFILYAKEHFGTVWAVVSNIGKAPCDFHASVFYIFIGVHLFIE